MEEVKFSGNGDNPEEEINPEVDYSQKTVYGGQVENAFRTAAAFNAIEKMITPGEDINGLLMRSDFPSKRADGYKLVIAWMTGLEKCRLFGDKEGEEAIFATLAALTSIDNARIKAMVTAVTGISYGNVNYSWESADQSLTKRLQRAAFGNPGSIKPS